MITESYSEMIPEMGVRSINTRGSSNDYNDELGRLMRERPTELDSDRERELSLLRSGSAPPIVQGSLGASFFDGNGSTSFSEEELRSDPNYSSYYYQNVNLNPRLPPPSAHQGPSGIRGSLAVGDRRRVNNGGGGGESLFSMQPGFGGSKDEHISQGNEWSSEGFISFSGLGLGSQQKSIADMMQDGVGNPSPVSRHPSHLASRAFEDTESPESHASLHHELASMGAVHSGTNMPGVSSLQSISSSMSQITPQVVRSHSPHMSALSGARVSSFDRRNASLPNLYDEVSPDMGESADLIGTLSGLSLSSGSLVDERKYPASQMQDDIAAQNSLFHLQRNKIPIKQHSYLNENLKGPSTPTLSSRGSSPSQYRSSPTSSLSNYGLGGFPASPLMLGNQMGGGNIPPLVENGLGTSLGVSGIDGRAFQGGLAFGPNSLATAAELENFARFGNHSSGDAYQMALMDPSYLQYQQSNEYSAAALNQRIHGESVANAPLFLALQKAYFEGLLQKAQYGMGYGKSSTLNNAYPGNSGYGLGFPYPGSPVGASMFPNPPIASGSPVGNMEQIMHFPSSLRDVAGNFMGPWPSETGCNLDESFPASLLDEFKGNKTRCFELAEIAGHVVEFSADQYGSRFIQQKLETASTQEKDMVFVEIMPHALSLMTDVFGNYVIQKFFEHGSPSQIRQLAEQLIGHVLTLSLQMYGCRVIQKALEVIELDQQAQMVEELDGHVMRCVRDQNGNHVIQKCIECVPEAAIHFIIHTFYDQVVTLSTHPYGCRVIQRVLEHCRNPQTQSVVMTEIFQSVGMLAQDQYGNYVIQHVLEHGKPHERTTIINQLTGKVVEMSQQKFASNVIEKCLSFGTPEERNALVHEMLGSTEENEPFQAMMKDQYANYVVQKVLETCDDQQLEVLLNRIKVHLNALKKYTYGKHIVARVEKLVAAGERRISSLSSSAAAAAAAALPK
ncbi:hypothetical protein ACS0TY_000898 [Phlomoides rotata]